jgi:hypothetical protein
MHSLQQAGAERIADHLADREAGDEAPMTPGPAPVASPISGTTGAMML